MTKILVRLSLRCYKLFAYLAKENSRQREEQSKDTEVKKYNEASVVSFYSNSLYLALNAASRPKNTLIFPKLPPPK